MKKGQTKARTMSMKPITKKCSYMMLSLALALPAMAADIPSQVTLIKNVNIFDGENEKLLEGHDVLVVRNLIKEIKKDIPTSGTYQLDVKTGGIKKLSGTFGCTDTYTVEVHTGEEKVEKKQVNVNVIDGRGRTLVPGFIDVHVHLMLNDAIYTSIYQNQPEYNGAKATAEARLMLMRGFTAVRDAGGPTIGLKRAVDERVVPGPRIYPSGPFLSQTSGHFDFDSSPTRFSPGFTGIPDKSAVCQWAFTADGVDEVQKAAREILRTGASQIKAAPGAGLASPFDPTHAWEHTLEEMQAIVYEAKKWDTYVMGHSFSDEGSRIAVEAGFRSIEHGYGLTENTLKLMKEKEVFLSTQFRLYAKPVSDFIPPYSPDSPQVKKYVKAQKDFDALYRSAKKIGLKMPFSTDLFSSMATQSEQPLEFTARAKYFSPYEIMVQATSVAAELLACSGKLNPYQDGPLGVVKEGAYADILIVDGNPLEDISLLADPEKNLKVIMKDGVIYKNTIQ